MTRYPMHRLRPQPPATGAGKWMLLAAGGGLALVWALLHVALPCAGGAAALILLLQIDGMLLLLLGCMAGTVWLKCKRSFVWFQSGQAVLLYWGLVRRRVPLCRVDYLEVRPLYPGGRGAALWGDYIVAYSSTRALPLFRVSYQPEAYQFLQQAIGARQGPQA